ncbi:hypothetical protein BC567DRAFT_277632 [Phyllosticta citribraziliensis]
MALLRSRAKAKSPKQKASAERPEPNGSDTEEVGDFEEAAEPAPAKPKAQGPERNMVSGKLLQGAHKDDITSNRVWSTEADSEHDQGHDEGHDTCSAACSAHDARLKTHLVPGPFGSVAAFNPHPMCEDRACTAAAAPKTPPRCAARRSTRWQRRRLVFRRHSSSDDDDDDDDDGSTQVLKSSLIPSSPLRHF